MSSTVVSTIYIDSYISTYISSYFDSYISLDYIYIFNPIACWRGLISDHVLSTCISRYALLIHTFPHFSKPLWTCPDYKEVAWIRIVILLLDQVYQTTTTPLLIRDLRWSQAGIWPSHCMSIILQKRLCHVISHLIVHASFNVAITLRISLLLPHHW